MSTFSCHETDFSLSCSMHRPQRHTWTSCKNLHIRAQRRSSLCKRSILNLFLLCHCHCFNFTAFMMHLHIHHHLFLLLETSSSELLPPFLMLFFKSWNWGVTYYKHSMYSWAALFPNEIPILVVIGLYQLCRLHLTIRIYQNSIYLINA